MLRQVNILSVPFSKVTKEDVLEEVGKILSTEGKTEYIVTPNPEIVVEARKNKEFKNALENARLSLADGVGVMVAAKILGVEAISRIPGVDLVELLCKEAVNENSMWSKKPVRIGFLGGRGGVAERSAECLQKKYPKLSVVYVDDEWRPEGFEKALRMDYVRFKTQDLGLRNQEHINEKRDGSGHNLNVRDQNTKHKIQNTKHIDILFVAFGSPKQEIWMYKNRDTITATLMVGVGGAFDMISGKVKRAPKTVRSLGLEWLYRLAKEPWRFRRQLALPLFIALVLKEKVSAS